MLCSIRKKNVNSKLFPSFIFMQGIIFVTHKKGANPQMGDIPFDTKLIKF